MGSTGRFGLAALAALLLAPAGALGQMLHVTPVAGAFLPASDVQELKDGAREIEVDRDAAAAVGVNVELGMLRGSIAYAPGFTIQDAVDGQTATGESTLLAVGAALVLRPIPRLLGIQPYALGGVGLKRQDYSWDDDGIQDAFDFPDDGSAFSFQVGAGADIMLGRLGLVVEVTDYIAASDDTDLARHDAFATVGLRLGIF